MSGFDKLALEEAKVRMQALYGENRKIAEGSYDKSLAVKCVNGTFVGKRADDVIAFRGIPFVLLTFLQTEKPGSGRFMTLKTST